MNTTDAGRFEPPAAGSELETLLGFLEHHRDTLAWKCSGLDDDQLRQRLEPTTMTLAGLLARMGTVEDFWFSQVIAERPFPLEHWPKEVENDPEWEWVSGMTLPGDELRMRWQAACQRSRDVIRHRPELDAVHAAWGGKAHLSTRWILTHMVEEYARHNGHADLLRESIDGATGV